MHLIKQTSFACGLLALISLAMLTTVALADGRYHKDGPVLNVSAIAVLK